MPKQAWNDLRTHFVDMQAAGQQVAGLVVHRTTGAPPLPDMPGDERIILGVHRSGDALHDRFMTLAGDDATIGRVRQLATRGADLMAQSNDLGPLAADLGAWTVLGGPGAAWWLVVSETTTARATWFEAEPGELVRVAADPGTLADIKSNVAWLRETGAPQADFPREWLNGLPGWWMAEFDAVAACVQVCDSVLNERAADVTTDPAAIKHQPDEALLSAKQIAQHFGLKPDPVRQKLTRWRRTNLDGFVEVGEPGEVKHYFYRLSAVAGLFSSMPRPSKKKSEQKTT